ncbi:MAG TPA: MEDS domain-containing protein [Acidobacteriaceae bacterium]
MEPAFPHQCLIYDGAPSRQLPAMAEVLRAKLGQNHRCLYLNSPPMVAGLRSYLAAAGVDVTQELARGSLVLSSEQTHLADGRFEIERMMRTLHSAVIRALLDGYAGLWATGDMTWEMGPERNFSKLLEYEWRLEEFMREHPAMSGICQYHVSTLPREALRHALLSHPAIFLNETLSRINPHYLPRAAFRPEATQSPEIDAAVSLYTGGAGAV